MNRYEPMIPPQSCIHCRVRFLAGDWVTAASGTAQLAHAGCQAKADAATRALLDAEDRIDALYASEFARGEADAFHDRRLGTRRVAIGHPGYVAGYTPRSSAWALRRPIGMVAGLAHA